MSHQRSVSAELLGLLGLLARLPACLLACMTRQKWDRGELPVSVVFVQHRLKVPGCYNIVNVQSPGSVVQREAGRDECVQWWDGRWQRSQVDRETKVCVKRELPFFFSFFVFLPSRIHNFLGVLRLVPT